MASRMSVTAYVDCTGPLFDGTAEQAVAEMTTEIAKRGAEYAKDALRERPMDKTGRARGGFQAHLQVVQKTAGFAVPGPMLTGVVWAPWLEGVSKRNKDTKFKGYRLFRDIRQELEDRVAQEIADKTLEEYLPRIGGES
jgi:hypothetical protein